MLVHPNVYCNLPGECHIIPFSFTVDSTNHPDGVLGRGFTVTRTGVGDFRITLANNQKYAFAMLTALPAGAGTDADLTIEVATVDEDASTGGVFNITLMDSGSPADTNNVVIRGVIFAITSPAPTIAQQT